MEQILLAYGQPKESVTAMMMLYKNTKVKVCSIDRDTDFFDIVTSVLQGYILAPYLFHNLPRLYTSNVDRFNKRKWLYT